MLAIDSPTLSFEMLELFESGRRPRLVAGYLGEPAAHLACRRRRCARRSRACRGAWHQDGAFMGEVRSLNLWLALSRCGDVAPGLDIVPRRLDEFAATGTDEAMLSYQVSQRAAEAAAGGAAIVRPVFEPGDAVFFDEMCLHQTASDPSMPNPRFAIENWFFGGSAFPREFFPVAV